MGISSGSCRIVLSGLMTLFGYLPRVVGQVTPNPIPLINNPLVPSTITPGGPAFTLTVNGTGFVSGAVASWNGSPRTTTFASTSQLTVNISASDIVKVGTASVIVANPGGLTSQPALFVIGNPAAAGFAFTIGTNNLNLAPCSNIVADFNGDGKPDLVACNGSGITVLLGNGDGTFRALPPINNIIVSPMLLVAADVNNDGKSDLTGIIAYNTSTTRLITMFGNGDGTFQQPVLSPPSMGLASPYSIGVGDFNADGRLDLAVTDTDASGNGQLEIWLGNGDCTFQRQIVYLAHSQPRGLAVGDFNRDGKLDLAVGDKTTGLAYVLIGNGDGTFQAPVTVGSATVATGGGAVTAGDVNGDGLLDLLQPGQNTLTVFLGKGDGTFGAGISFPTTPTMIDEQPPILIDLNSDGKLDLVIGTDSGISVLLGNGDGTFQQHTDIPLPSGIALVPGLPTLATGDFNQDGRLDLVVPQGVLLQTTVQLSSFAVSFGNQNDGTISAPQNVTLTNLAPSALMISSVAVAGTNSGDFAIQSNSCGTTVPATASCAVSITFTPAAKGMRNASLVFADGAQASPQIVALSGTGLPAFPPAVSFSPTSLTFPSQFVSTKSTQLTVTVTNTGDLALTVNGFVFQGTNPEDFAQTNNCQDLPGGASCSVNVTFTPTAVGARSATLNMIDNAANSPQALPVTGTGSGAALGLVVPSGFSNSASVQAGGTASYTLAIGGAGMSGTASLACTGAPQGAMCTVPSAVSVASATASIFTVTVTTTSRMLSALRLIEKHPVSWAWGMFLLGIAIRLRVKSKKRTLLRLAWLIPLAAFLCSCGGGNSVNPNGTPAGTYTLTVTANSGTTSQSVDLKLQVN